MRSTKQQAKSSRRFVVQTIHITNIVHSMDDLINRNSNVKSNFPLIEGTVKTEYVISRYTMRCLR